MIDINSFVIIIEDSLLICINIPRFLTIEMYTNLNYHLCQDVDS